MTGGAPPLADALPDRRRGPMSAPRPGPWAATVLTLFPAAFPASLGHSLAGRALAGGLWTLDTVDIRDFAPDRHASVDDTPFGGGPGMVMRADIVDAALRAVPADGRARIYLSPRGAALTQERARELAAGPGAVILCGRYEGVDQRAIEAHALEEMSIGDYVLSGGEPAAAVLIDACVRLLPGTVGDAQSLAEESFERGLLEHPHYTRPQTWNGMAVPEVLLSGHHARIAAWRLAQAEEITRRRRPDLWARYAGRQAGKGA